MKEVKIGDIVLVNWVDSKRTIDWTYQEPSLYLVAHQSIGFLSHMSSQAINVQPHRAVDKDGDQQHFGDMTIPRCAVLSIAVLA